MQESCFPEVPVEMLTILYSTAVLLMDLWVVKLAFCINNGNDLDASPIFRTSETGVSVAGTFAILSSPGGYEDLYLSNSAIITNDGDGAFADRTGSNIDHIWHDDSGSGGTWNFCSDTTYRTTGNSLGQFGTLKCGSSGTLRDNTGQYGSIEITGGNTANYGGYSIEGEAVFMRNATNGIYGLYDDDNNDWVYSPRLYSWRTNRFISCWNCKNDNKK